MIKYNLPKGIRSFSPIELAERKYIFNILKQIFKSYGYQYIETPIINNLNLLENNNNNKLIFKIINSGDILSKVNINTCLDTEYLHKLICNKGLRYDLTIPLLQYMHRHINNINLPFKCYQIQKVWRADKPQKGRYREFYQCDIDIIGSNSIIDEVELISIFYHALTRLGFKNFTFYINHINILYNILIISKCDHLFKEISIEIDKINKIGLKQFKKNLASYNIALDTINSIMDYMNLKDSNQLLNIIENDFVNKKLDLKGINEIKSFFRYIQYFNLNTQHIKFDHKLTRGLNYYTGMIFEVIINDMNIGSVGGGGRYDSINSNIGLNNMGRVGISFGIERIYDIMKNMNMFNNIDVIKHNIKILLVNINNNSLEYSLSLLNNIRKININIQFYSKFTNCTKAIQYALNKKINYIIFIGNTEMNNNYFKIKNLINKNYYTIYNVNELINIIN